MNNVVLVGHLAQDLEINEQENKKCVELLLEVNRPFKNAKGTYDIDIIPCRLWEGIAINATICCKKGDTVGIKGRIQSDEKGTYVVIERLSFLSTKKPSEVKENGRN